MDAPVIIGTLAACATTISFLPQAIKVITTRDTKSISLLMYVIFSFGVCLWFIYGLLRGDVPVIAANGVTLILALIILFFKINEKRSSRR